MPSCDGANCVGSGLHQSKPPGVVAGTGVMPPVARYGFENPEPVIEVPTALTSSGLSVSGRSTSRRSAGAAK